MGSSRALKIAFVWTYPVFPATGGVERVTSILLQEFSDFGHTCLTLEVNENTGDILYQRERIGDVKRFLEDHKIDVVVDQNGNSSKFGEALRGSGWDGVFLVALHTDPAFLVKVFDLYRAMYEVTRSGQALFYRFAWVLRVICYPIWRCRTRYRARRTAIENYCNADRVVILSKRFVQVYERIIGTRTVNKLVIIPNPTPFVNPENDLQENLDKKKIALVVARLFEPEKRISLAIRAWTILEQQHSDWKLIILGTGPDLQCYKRQCLKAGLKNVEFVGWQDPVHYYQIASLLFVTSKTEGWNLSIVEAQQHGVVAIAMDSYATLSDIIDNNFNGVVIENGDVKGFARAASELMVDQVRREALSVAARSSVKKFSTKIIAKKWDDLFYQCLEPRQL